MDNLSNSDYFDINNLLTLDDYCQSETPEKYLMAAVLERAILDLNSADIQDRQDAELWFKSKCPVVQVYSYRYICLHLGLEADSTRKAIFSKYIKTRRTRTKPSVVKRGNLKTLSSY